MTLLEGFLWLALNVYHEARSEPQVGQVAIAHVTLNRAKQQNITVEEVIKQPNQFKWIGKKSYFPEDIPAFCQSMKSAYIALSSTDFTEGATYFHRKNLNPKWVVHLTYLDKYGSHKFYR